MIARRQTLLLLAHTALTQIVVFVLRPTTAYRAIELDVPAAGLGVLSASFALAPLVLALPSGQFVDRFGEKRVMLAGSAILCLAGALFIVIGDSIAGLIAASIGLGTGQLCCVVGQQASIANTVGPGQHDTAFGHYTFAASLGQMLGPAMILLFGGRETIPDTARIFVWSTLLIVLLLGCTLLLRDPPRQRRESDAASGGVRALVRIPGLMRAVMASGVLLAAVDITLVYLPALGAERGLASGVVGLLLAVRAGSSMVSRFFLGHLSRLVGRRRLLLASFFVTAATLVLAPVPQPLWLLLVVVTLLGFGLGVGPPLTMSWVSEAAPPGLRGRAIALRITGNRIGQVLIPSAVGVVAGGLGVAGVLWATSAALVAVTFGVRGLRDSATPREEEVSS
ncbi:MAG TPA: MFS transporter [Acidothermales bacterium]